MKNLFFLLLTSLVLLSCRQEYSHLQQPPLIEADTHLVPPEGFSFTVRQETPELLAASRKGGIKGKPEKPPKGGSGGGDSTSNPPTSYAGRPVLLLDFNGHTVTGTRWNASIDTIVCNYSGMTAEEIQKVVDSSAYDFAPFGIVVTTDEAVYQAAHPYKRRRIIVTESWQWYGQAGGAAFVNSFTWGDESPAYVFSSLLRYNPKNVFEAVSHEGGHTIGLRHQSEYKLNADGSYYRDINGNLVKLNEYDRGTPELAPILGVGYYAARSEFRKGLNSLGQLVDEPAFIKAVVQR